MGEASESSKRGVHPKDPRWQQLPVKKKMLDGNAFGKKLI